MYSGWREAIAVYKDAFRVRMRRGRWHTLYPVDILLMAIYVFLFTLTFNGLPDIFWQFQVFFEKRRQENKSSNGTVGVALDGTATNEFVPPRGIPAVRRLVYFHVSIRFHALLYYYFYYYSPFVHRIYSFIIYVWF